jgi:hypothetical protein
VPVEAGACASRVVTANAAANAPQRAFFTVFMIFIPLDI